MQKNLKLKSIYDQEYLINNQYLLWCILVEFRNKIIFQIFAR